MTAGFPASALSGDGAAILRTALISHWADGLARAVYLPMSPRELRVFLRTAADQLIRAVAAEPPDLEAARGVGRRMVQTGLIADVVIPATTTALATHLPALTRAHGSTAGDHATTLVLGAVFDGYVDAARRRVLAEQEAVRRAEAEARRQAEEALRVSEARFRTIFTDAAVGIGIADLGGRIVDANQSFAAMLGYTVEEFCRLSVSDFVDPDDAQGMWEVYEEIIAGRRDVARMQKRYRHKDGHQVWTELTASLMRDRDGTPQFTVAMVEDITARRRLQEELRYQAVHDPLTQLPNRALFQERLSTAFATPGSRIGICYLDLDRFKIINDTLGHHVGDELLVLIARRLSDEVSARGHLAARMGGDEFVILVVDPPENALTELADSVLEALARPAHVLGHDLRVSASMGVVETRVEETTPADVLRAADATLYWAKAEGRNRWATFDAERNARELARYSLAATLVPALDAGEFAVHYQPIVDLGDGRVRGLEALVRWHHPNLGWLQPERFVDLAEETGAIVPLGRHVLQQACAQVARWNRGHPGDALFVSVNVAMRQTWEPGLVDDVGEALRASGLPGHLLQLELTESALLDPGGRAVEALTALADTDVRIAIDDFGTGYSNLGYLPRLPLHTLKLASGLVEGELLTDQSPFLSGLITFAHDLGLHVTAEGVETSSQAKRLRDTGCDTAQGWLFGRPATWPHLVREHLGPVAHTTAMSR